MRTAAVPARTTNTSSRVNECGVAGVPGAISTCHTAVSVDPVEGVASAVNRAPPRSWVGRAGMGMTGMVAPVARDDGRLR
jgi:hypothetical protein